MKSEQLRRLGQSSGAADASMLPKLTGGLGDGGGEGRRWSTSLKNRAVSAGMKGEHGVITQTASSRANVRLHVQPGAANGDTALVAHHCTMCKLSRDRTCRTH